MTSVPAISVENLTKYYGKSIGVSNINFKINQGEIFGFLGPNGAGKTTTIRLILDMLRPTSGMIKVFGKEVQKNSIETRSSIGYLPGNFSSFDNMTGHEFLQFVASQRKIEFKHPTKLYERFELSTKDLNKKIKQLSHGMMQKLGIIQAVFHKPALLILDEPTIGLDPLMQEEFYSLLKEIQKNNCTIFFSSHNLSEVERICHRVAVIKGGKLVALETLENLKKKRFRKLNLTLKHKPDNLKLENTELIEQNGLNYEYLVKGDVNTLISDLQKLPIEDFVFPEPNLDEVFRAFYRRAKK